MADELSSVLTSFGVFIVMLAGVALLVGARRQVSFQIFFWGIVIVVVGGNGIADRIDFEALVEGLDLPEIANVNVLYYLFFFILVLILLNLLRLFMALFVGRAAANSAVGNILALSIVGSAKMAFRPFRRIFRGFNRSQDDL